MMHVRGVHISEREIIAVRKIYKSGKMYFPAEIRNTLDLQVPCTVIFELNEDNEIVVRSNDLNNKGDD